MVSVSGRHAHASQCPATMPSRVMLVLSPSTPITQHCTIVAPFQANSPMTGSWQRRCGDHWHYLHLTPPTTGMVLLGWTLLLLLLLFFIHHRAVFVISLMHQDPT